MRMTMTERTDVPAGAIGDAQADPVDVDPANIDAAGVAEAGRRVAAAARSIRMDLRNI
jgi:hypothetical protein